MAFTSTIRFSDTVDLGTATDTRLQADLQTALQNWSQYIAGVGPVVVSLVIGTSGTLGTADGGPDSSQFYYAAGQTSVVMDSSLAALVDGNASGATSIDITVDKSFISTMLTSTAIGDDAVSVFMHELTHGFGMSGYLQSNGTLQSGGYESVYDQYVQINSNGTANFIGPNAEAVYGGPVPLTTTYAPENYYHFGNNTTDPIIGTDLMNGIAGQLGATISDLDIAVLKDLGIPITRLVDKAAPPIDVFAGPTGARQSITFASGTDAVRAQPLLDTGGGASLQLISSGGVYAATQKTVVASTSAAPVTLFGGSKTGEAVVGVDERLVFSATGSGSLVAGGGGDAVFIQNALGPWNLATGGGNDTIVAASGADTIDAGGGANILYLGSGASTVTSEGVDTIVGSTGTDVIAVSGPGALVFGGGGGVSMTLSNGVSTVAGLQGSVVVAGGTGAGLFFGGTSGRNQITAPTGQSTIVGGGAADMLTASGTLGDVIAAGAGAETITGAGSTGSNTFFAGGGPDVVVGGAGATAIEAGSGNATLSGGSGPALFVFINGHGGGTDLITNFSATLDRITLQGFAANAPDTALAGAVLSNGTTTLSLADGTHIAFAGVTNLARASFV